MIWFPDAALNYRAAREFRECETPATREAGFQN